MSKVEVRRGDRWGVVVDSLLLVRGESVALVASKTELAQSITWGRTSQLVYIPEPAARAWIEFLGGIVVEEREEAVPAKVVAHLDVTASEDNGEVHLSVEGSQSCKWRDREPDLYRRIHIAGVTT